MILTHFNIHDPLDDPDTFKFAKKALKLGFGNTIKITRADPKDDYYLGIDLIVIRVAENIPVQVKTSTFKTTNKNNLKVHLNYQTVDGHDCGFELYSKKPIKYFLFIWPNSNYALLTKFTETMQVWDKNQNTWKRNNNHCDNGCYVALKVSYFIKLLNKDNYRMYKIN